MDADGYGFRPDDRGLERLLQDFRTLSPAGVERAAWGWELHVGRSGRDQFAKAEAQALESIKKGGRWDAWEATRRAIYGLTEGDHAVISWEVEHEERESQGRDAEHAAYGAALALVAGDQLDEANRRVLLTPMAEAVPWLIPGYHPTPLPEPRGRR
jgi:hypothetical protein